MWHSLRTPPERRGSSGKKPQIAPSRALAVEGVIERGDEALLVGGTRQRDLLALRTALADEEGRRAGDLVGGHRGVEALGLLRDRSGGGETQGVGNAEARDARHRLPDH